MREIRPSGSEGGETGRPVFPTPIVVTESPPRGETSSRVAIAT